MNDEPNFDQHQTVANSRQNDHLKTGDAIQEWSIRLDKDGMVERYWLNGDVLSVVEKPCGGDMAPDWVALVQWHEGGEVKRWTALPQHDWIAKSIMLRRKSV